MSNIVSLHEAAKKRARGRDKCWKARNPCRCFCIRDAIQHEFDRPFETHPSLRRQVIVAFLTPIVRYRVLVPIVLFDGQGLQVTTHNDDDDDELRAALLEYGGDEAKRALDPAGVGLLYQGGVS